ncbi:hypothetical protein MXAN_0834 [Myxococcus xanthus DK 1622]|uniref:Uncharacterized protein n=1 Tax=Myxococcus xanthus (strain DK1622) TaxID=246197 RepID=Q1DE27_MYXXD|nr:hypothetical protein MXAN_0834 [Myxococcus xanthus DK 1622]
MGDSFTLALFMFQPSPGGSPAGLPGDGDEA